MRLVPGYFLCACSWHGQLGSKTPCPACGRPAIDRIDQPRLDALRAVQADPAARVLPMRRIRLLEIGALRRAGPPPPPNDDGRHKRVPTRLHAVTPLGLAVLAVAEQLEREAQQRREHVAAAAARHGAIAALIADLPEIEPEPGWEQRCVDRARRAGIIR